MRISDSTPPFQPVSGSSNADRPRDPEEAAQKFEEVLARQFVQVMTKDLFKNRLSGEEGPAWMDGYADTQRDLLTDALAKHLVDEGTLGLSDLLIRRWGLAGAAENVDQNTPSPENPERL